MQACPVSAIEMITDQDGFRYPSINSDVCISCGLCNRICSSDAKIKKTTPRSCFGGHIKDGFVLAESTSGGLFTAIAASFLKQGGHVFGVMPSGQYGARHARVESESDLSDFRGSKYVQSEVGNAYSDALKLIKAGERVLFSGTPCQIAGLKAVLGKWSDCNLLLTVEVICEGVPSPLFAEKQCASVSEKAFGGKPVDRLQYRYKASNRWDYEVARFSTKSGEERCLDRWFNPFWNIWLNRLMSRPSCDGCVFAGPERCADISLGDLWGVHLYCPDLYNGNRGASIAFCNTEEGEGTLASAAEKVDGRWLNVDDAIRYQKPMREPALANPGRVEFMSDLHVLSYEELCRKWAKKPSIGLLISKYLWGTNAQVCRRKLAKGETVNPGQGKGKGEHNA